MPVQILKHILYSEASGGYSRYAPSADVQPVVAEFFVYTYEQECARELALGDGLPALLFMPGRYLAMRFAADDGASRRGPGYLAGPIMEQTYVDIPPGVDSVFGVRFTAQGLYRLVGQSVSRLRNQHSWNLRELWGADADILAERVAVASLQEKMRLVEEFVRKRMRRCDENPLFTEAINMLRCSRGQVSIDELCSALHINYKWLERQFKLYLGIAPKEYARLQRFLHAFFEIEQSPRADVLDIAVRSGYCDHNHLAKEFKRFTGRAPLQYTRNAAECFATEAQRTQRGFLIEDKILE